jgi:ABC-2 type transport system ATP-binding protein
VRIAGMPPRRYAEAHGIGYLPELLAINREWKVEDALVRFGILEGMAAAHLRARVAAVLVDFALEDHRRKLIRELSKGTLQRVGLAQAMLRPHDVVIFDEPTHGLDPVWTYKFRELVDAFRAPNRAMLIASHNLDELQRLADRVVIIDRGRVQRSVDLKANAESTAVVYQLEVAAGAGRVSEIFPGAEMTDTNTFTLPPMEAAALNAGLARLVGAGGLVTGLSRAHSSLERHFREAVGQ